VIKEIIPFIAEKDISPLFQKNGKYKKKGFIFHLKKDGFLFKNSYNLKEGGKKQKEGRKQNRKEKK
jgi:hypothetical protein